MKIRAILFLKTKGKWLGVIIDIKVLTFTILGEKNVKLKANTENILNQKSVTSKHLTKIAVLLSYMYLA